MWAEHGGGAQYARAVRLFDEMGRLHRVWMHVRPEPPLKRSDLGLLGTLDRMQHEGGAPVTPTALAKHLRMSPPAVSQKLRTLEAEGYVRRKSHKDDRRISFVVLTPKGKKASENNWKQMLQRMESALQQLGDGEAATLLQLMGSLSAALEKTREGGECTC